MTLLCEVKVDLTDNLAIIYSLYGYGRIEIPPRDGRFRFYTNKFITLSLTIRNSDSSILIINLNNLLLL